MENKLEENPTTNFHKQKFIQPLIMKTSKNLEYYNNKRILITGGSGFIGGHLVRRLLKETNCLIFNIDNLSYASDNESITKLKECKNRYFLYKINLKDSLLTSKAVQESKPDLIFHLAAETHVDRSLDNPLVFVETNILGTFNILQAALNYFQTLSTLQKDNFRFHHISTDEVFGSLGVLGKFDEKTKYAPKSPYSSTKASSDHLVNAWFHSYKLPILITNCSNNYGPYQFPEKLIPLSIIKALRGDSIQIYGKGENIRDWLYVEDHIDAILCVADRGTVGKTYCIGGNCEKSNNELIKIICELLDEIYPNESSYAELIKYVEDRPGHDFRYSIDCSFIKKELGWEPNTKIKDGLKKTVSWYVKNKDWCNDIFKSSGYKGQRMGI